ncbi:TRAP-type C4-dicarboxylate transport system, small permease component [Tistlia consotensis]|uniref:TRAP transporter small permease protein n=1 Tax=Tistlia consotensis USBA 355 TaxID=560819 RepID=A0A1Y6CQ31_9PROT|nr:TRAP transporter small permease [Tistlia consotensis]SMF68684.1 TRAP-type C4-dicarboxylate transport system, small permease component [Tistlia consotensis USBA 355]SNS01206.1 TRAP-type C4-dicarboxylate transport system, small permease component [Tistlia consotensis]
MGPLSDPGLGTPGRHTLLERGGVTAAGLALVTLCLIVTLNVISRALWRAVVPDDILLVSELMLIVILGPIALVTAEREHIEVTVFTERVGQGGRRLLACLGHLAGIAFFGFLLAAFWKLTLKSWQTGEFYDGLLAIPQWPGQALATAAFAGIILRLAFLLRTDLTGGRERP